MVRSKTRKYLLKRPLARVVLQRVLDRPKKGFGIPPAAWLGGFPISAKNCAGLNEGFVERHIVAHRSGRADHRLFPWNWMVLGQVLRGNAGETRTGAGAA
jgi:asparagine synthase (glutamine-hydrolysing)